MIINKKDIKNLIGLKFYAKSNDNYSYQIMSHDSTTILIDGYDKINNNKFSWNQRITINSLIENINNKSFDFDKKSMRKIKMKRLNL